MRVISGLARGTKINSIESQDTRPTLDRVKESLFNILQDRIKNSYILDLFAGSGSLGIEALSRGAKYVYFCEINPYAVKIINENLNKTKLANNFMIINKDYKIALKQIKQKIDIIFLDPPYKLDLSGKAIKEILELEILEDNGIIVVETDEVARDIKEIEEINEIEIVDKRKYGRANLIFVKKRGN